MKKYLIIIILLFLQYDIYAQGNHSIDSIKYQAAYNIIVNDTLNKGKTLMVLDSIVELSLVFFYKELKQRDEDDVAVMTRLYKINENIDSGFTLTFLGNRNRKYSNNIVFFSPIINDSILRANLYTNERSLNRHEHRHTPAYGIGSLYLFIFDKHGKLKSFFRKEMIWG